MKTALVIDDHPVTHVGCGQLLREAGYDAVLDAMTSHDAYRLAEAHRPGLVVLDLGMPGVGGLNMIEPLLVRSPGSRILVFSMNEQTVFVAKSLEAGARGYLSKNSSPAELAEAVRTLEAGEVFLTRKAAISVATMRAGGRADPMSQLTEREHQVLRLIGLGSDLQSIADSLTISYKTAANASSSLKRKLGASTTSELIRIAVEHDLR